METLGYAIGLVTVILGVGWAIERLAATFVADPAEARTNKDTMSARARLLNLFQARLYHREAEVMKLKADLAHIEGANEKLRKRKDILRRMDGEHIRIIGEESKEANQFIAHVINRYAAKGQAHPTIDPSWAKPQRIEVWTRDMQEARLLLERRYPSSLGYNVTKIYEGSVRTAAGQAGAAA